MCFHEHTFLVEKCTQKLLHDMEINKHCHYQKQDYETKINEAVLLVKTP